MGWRDDYQPASIDGVGFGVESSDTGAGRRTARHEFPQRELPYVEDLGRKAKEFRLQGFVVGEDYFAHRNELMAVLELKGARKLVHPYLGTMLVSVDGFNVRESRQNGGMAVFTMTLIEAGKTESPTVNESSDVAVKAAADAVNTAAAAEYESAIVVENVSEYYREDVAAEIESVGYSLAGLDVFSRATQAVAAFGRRATNLIDSASSLATSPASFVLELRETIASIADAADNAIDALYAYEALLDMTYTVTTVNSGLVTNLAMQFVVGEAAKVALDVGWDSYEQALEGRDTLIASIDDLSSTAPDDLLDSLEGLRAEVVNGIPSSAEDLPRIGEIELTQTLPSLVVAYNFYDDISAGEDIVSRNKIRHPAFVPGGRSLEVLIND